MHALYVVWWVQERELSPATVAAIMAAGDLALTALEVPTGWFADRFGHRRSLIAGSALQMAGMLCCWLGRDVPALIVASLLVALGDAFRSGAEQALLYRSCLTLGREQDFQRIEARAQAMESAGLVGLVLAGGAIVGTLGFAAGWLVETAVSCVGLVIAWRMTEPPAAEDDDQHAAPDGARSRRSFPRSLLVLVLPTAGLGAIASAALFVAQASADTRPLAVTMIVAFATLAEGSGAWAAGRLTIGGVHTLSKLFLGGLLVALLGVLVDSAFLPVVLVLSFLSGLAAPLRAVAIQRLAADRARARAASLASALDMACSTLLLPVAGMWATRKRSR